MGCKGGDRDGNFGQKEMESQKAKGGKRPSPDHRLRENAYIFMRQEANPLLRDLGVSVRDSWLDTFDV